MAKTTTMPPSDQDDNKDSKASAAPTHGQIIQKRNDESPTVEEVLGLEQSIVKPHGDAIVKLDKLLIESEARGTIYCIALGLIAKQARVALKKANPKKKQSDLLGEFIGSLKLSAGRSVRTVERYMEVAQNLIDDGTLKGVLQDSLRAANFTDAVKAEVLQVTDNMGITDLYVKYAMIGDEKSKNKGPKRKAQSGVKAKADGNLALEQRLDHALSVALEDLNRLLGIRDEIIAAGQEIDEALNDVLDYAAETVSALMNHPLIAAKFEPVTEDEEPEKPAKA